MNSNNDNRKIQNIIFDLDGTILESGTDIFLCVNHLLKKYNLAEVSFNSVVEGIGRGARHLINKVLRDSFELSTPDFTIESIYDNFISDYMDYYLEFASKNSKLYDGVLEHIKSLHELGYNMLILTNKPHDVTLATIKCLDIEKYFIEIVGVGKYEYKKPDIEVWNILSKSHNLTPENTIMVGDGVPDYEFAKVATCHVCVVLYGITTRDDLLPLNAEKYADTFDDVVDYIKSLG